mmetsp:Transcript_10761/g.37678  ORF Transcript_10761/g.37678 Transcript_10761/m.37678 type:complete len:243 (-) Transcript_10761:531-1259(-)
MPLDRSVHRKAQSRPSPILSRREVSNMCSTLLSIVPNVILSMEKPFELQKPVCAPSFEKAPFPAYENASKPFMHFMTPSTLLFARLASCMHFSASVCHFSTSFSNCFFVASCSSLISFRRSIKRFSSLSRASTSVALLVCKPPICCSSFSLSKANSRTLSSSLLHLDCILLKWTAFLKELAANFFSKVSDWTTMYIKQPPITKVIKMSTYVLRWLAATSRMRLDAFGNSETISTMVEVSSSS